MRNTIYFTLILFALQSCYQGSEADLIIHNAQIYTCDENFSVHKAMAIKDGKILQLGPNREILNGYKAKHIIDAELAPIYPGFYDAHCHFYAYSETLREVDLNNCQSFDEMVERIVSFDKKNDLEWITGRGWDHTLWENEQLPNNDTLNKLFPNKPIFVKRIDGHAALANKKALDIANITIESEILGGLFEKKDNQLTGVLIDNACDEVSKFIPVTDENTALEYLQKAERNLFAQGLTSINDAGVDAYQRDLFIKWYEKNDLKIRSYMMLFPDDENIDFVSENGIYKKGNLHIKSFKLIADGAMGSHGACLLKPYSDEPTHGFLLKDIKEIESILNFAVEMNYQVNTHCIGDSANRVMLNLYDKYIKDKFNHRWKIEHAQVLAPEDFDFFENLQIIPSVQPTHCTSDMRWAEKRLGSERVKFAYAYNDLLKKAGLLALGTDFPIENISVLETFYAAVARKNKEGEPQNGFQPENALSRKDALMGITYWAAYSNFEEHERGSLAPGKKADFVFLSKDILTIPEEEILKTFVIRTFLNGEEVYNAK